jgi:competence protein ComEC
MSHPRSSPQPLNRSAFQSSALASPAPPVPAPAFSTSAPPSSPPKNLGPPRPALRPLQFVTYPVLFAALAFACGIALAQILWRPPPWLLISAAVGFFAILLCPRVPRILSLLALLAAWLVTGIFAAELQPHPTLPTAIAVAADYTEHPFTGRILHLDTPREDPGVRGKPHSLQSITLALGSANNVAVPAAAHTLRNARLTLLAENDAPLPALRCGDTLSFTAKLHPPARYFTPGAWSESDWLAQQNIYALGSLPANQILAIAPAPHHSLLCLLDTARNFALLRLDQLALRMSAWPASLHAVTLTPQDAAILSAMLLGDRSRLSPEIRTGLQRIGAFHLLVVSGLSVAIIAGFLWFVLRRLRMPPLPATLITLVLLTLYALLTGFAPPVQRALLMTAVYLLTRLLNRRSNPLNAIAIALLALLIAEPDALLSSSLQMTFLAVLAIAGIAAPLLERFLSPWLRAARSVDLLAYDSNLPPRLTQFRITLRLWSEALRPALGRRIARRLPSAATVLLLHFIQLAFVSFILELVLALPMAIDFHRLTVLSLPGNVFTVPLLALLLPLALGTLLLASISLHLAMPVAVLLAALLHLISGIVLHISALPSAEWRLAPTRPLAIVLALICFSLAVFLARRPRRIFAWATLAATIAMAACALWSVPLRVHPAVLEVTAIDVGQGDSILVVAPQHATLLVDAGGPAGPFGTEASGAFYGEDIVSNYLWSRGIRHLDAVALTHAHSDHMGGMPTVLLNFRPRELWVGSGNPPALPYLALLAQAASLGVRIRTLHAGDAFTFGGSQVEVLAPAANYAPGRAPANDDSLVLHIADGATSVLLEGDAQHVSEAAMLSNPLTAAELPSTLLKVGHHGSLSSTTPAFLAAVSPTDAVISAGRHNSYGHPRYPILQRLGNAHVITYRTDLDGASSFLLDGHSVTPVAP